MNGLAKRGISLVELLVAMIVALVLAALVASAISAARTSQKAAVTRAMIGKLGQILETQLERYASRPVSMAGLPTTSSGAPLMSRNAYRAWYLRRQLISGDMPDRWSDVQYMAENPAQFPPASLTAAQRTYVTTWNSLSAAQKAAIPLEHGSAECLFMVIMQGSLADCLECVALKSSDIGDKDGDGMMEFWDAWQNPIEFLLWAPALELPAGSGMRFFSGSRGLDDPLPTTGSVRPTLGMRPLVYSPGPDGLSGFSRGADGATLGLGSSPVGRDCGNPLTGSTALAGGLAAPSECRLDNVTNLDAEARP